LPVRLDRDRIDRIALSVDDSSVSERRVESSSAGLSGCEHEYEGQEQADEHSCHRVLDHGIIASRSKGDNVRLRICLSALVLTSLAGCGGSGKPPVLGTWQGTLHQQGLAPFTVTATVTSITPPERNTVHYSGIDCHGRWTYLGRAGAA